MSHDVSNRARHNELLQMLNARRAEAAARYRQALERQLSGAAAGDSEGVHGWKASREGGAEVAVLETMDRTLRQIDTALARLHSGRYGFCSACSDPIPLARL